MICYSENQKFSGKGLLTFPPLAMALYHIIFCIHAAYIGRRTIKYLILIDISTKFLALPHKFNVWMAILLLLIRN